MGSDKVTERSRVNTIRAGVPNTSIAIDRSIAKVVWVDRMALKVQVSQSELYCAIRVHAVMRGPHLLI